MLRLSYAGSIVFAVPTQLACGSVGIIEGAGLDELHAASMWAIWTCWLMPLMSITAPQKHLDWPLASCVGSLHPESHIAYFHTVQALGAVVTRCTFIQITTAITPKDPTTVRATKQRSKKSI
jgi:hypothetical protein